MPSAFDSHLWLNLRGIQLYLKMSVMSRCVIGLGMHFELSSCLFSGSGESINPSWIVPKVKVGKGQQESK